MSTARCHSSETRNRLIEAALKCFAVHGYSGVGVRQIASSTSVNSALIYYHFGSKTGLYQEVLQHVMSSKGRRLVDLAEKLSAGPDASDLQVIKGLKEFISVFLDSIMSANSSDPMDDAATALLCRELEAPSLQFNTLLVGFARPIAKYLDHVVRHLRPELGQADRFAMALSITGQLLYMRNALASLRVLCGDPGWPHDLHALAKHFFEFSLRGLNTGETLDLAAFSPRQMDSCTQASRL